MRFEGKVCSMGSCLYRPCRQRSSLNSQSGPLRRLTLWPSFRWIGAMTDNPLSCADHCPEYTDLHSRTVESDRSKEENLLRFVRCPEVLIPYLNVGFLQAGA